MHGENMSVGRRIAREVKYALSEEKLSTLLS
jgi:5-formaminoimidazole-4-carboxamide-1-beta-D-ribofuranosyl 5'-monophosphate synthetase